MAGLFKGLGQAKARFDSNYEKPGHYYHRIDKFKVGVTRKQEDFLAVEKTVLHVLDDDEGKGHRVGESVTHMMMTKHDSFLGNLKAMLSAILDMDPTEITEELAEEITADDQPLAMTAIECKNRNIVLKTTGGDFTAINYIREVPAHEILEILTASEKVQVFYPNNWLQNAIAGQEANAAATA